MHACTNKWIIMKFLCLTRLYFTFLAHHQNNILPYLNCRATRSLTEEYGKWVGNK